MNWTPQPSDIEWTRTWLGRLNDNGVWGIPRNQSIWRHDATHKVLRCIHGERDTMFDALTAVCQKLGYTTEYCPEAMSPEQVQTHMEATKLTEDMFGSGKTTTRTQSVGPKQYLCRPITDADRAVYRKNLAKIPKHMRWKGKATPQCDFCAHDQPIVTYAAHRMTTGEVRECWRWLACPACHEAITSNDFKTIERRTASVFASPGTQETFAVKMALMAFHADAVQINATDGN
jgi:hypothetical protein